jgi:alcohol dehydrogenase
MMGLAFAQAMFKQKISVADSARPRETWLKNGADVAYDPSEADVVSASSRKPRWIDEVVDFAGNEIDGLASLLSRGQDRGLGPMGGNFSLMVQWVYKRMTIEGFMVGTLAEAQELMRWRAGKISRRR